MSASIPPRVCVIGAGPCGLTAVKNLREAGLNDVLCYDENDAIGGNWVFREEPATTSVYASTHIISSRKLSSFFDYPMPQTYPDFPSHTQMLAYFNSYAHHFGVLPHVRLRTKVKHATLSPDGRWIVQVVDAGGTTSESFDHLLVCSGHHREANVPDHWRKFSGIMMHSREFKRADARFAGKRVLIIGGGNSACDIAVDVSRLAQRTCLSMRRPYYIVPKVVFGRPVDALYQRMQRLPRFLVPSLMRWMLKLAIGSWRRYGLACPHGGPLQTHPTLNSKILDELRYGTIIPRTGIDRFDNAQVHFTDGSAETFDIVIWATGFRIAFPFFDRAVINWDTLMPPPLYLKMMHPIITNLYFIGLFQPIGCIWRLADHQARIAALQITGRLDRPADIAERIDHELRSPHWRFDHTPRHAIEVDYHEFRRELTAEIARAQV
jgi:hypothetical protein